MKQYLYLALCIIGFALPYSQFVPFLAEHGLNIRLVVAQLFASRISSFFALDVIVSSVVLWCFISIEGRRQKMKHVWVCFVCTLTVGVSLALPLFLYLRERKLAQQSAAKAAA